MEETVFLKLTRDCFLCFPRSEIQKPQNTRNPQQGWENQSSAECALGRLGMFSLFFFARFAFCCCRHGWLCSGSLTDQFQGGVTKNCCNMCVCVCVRLSFGFCFNQPNEGTLKKETQILCSSSIIERMTSRRNPAAFPQLHVSMYCWPCLGHCGLIALCCSC